MVRSLIFLFAAAVVAGCAQSGPEVTRKPENPPTVAKALAAEDCSGGEVFFIEEEGIYEVLSASCADGNRYDLRLDTAFQVIAKERED